MNTNDVHPSALILVAVIPSPRDLEIARLLGWYRIPLRHAPKVIEVDYLAFFQTSGFAPDHRGRIEAVAAVRGHELTTRRELFHDEPEHPRAGEEYYKLQLGSLLPLPEPIRAEKWRRITFFYTTGGLLHRAKKVEDLVVRSDEREQLWRSLRERALASNRYQAEEIPAFPLPPDLLLQLGQDLFK